MTKIGFIGLGHMGKPMVKNLLKAGHSVEVYDLLPEARLALENAGALPVTKPQEFSKDLDVIITMLQSGEQVLQTCLGEQGIFSQLAPQSLYIDSSSIEMKATQELHQAAQKHQLHMLDAPVSGGVSGAENATLTIMVGGTEENFKKAKPLLEAMGKKIIHAGIPGHGQAAKICNNLILGISMIAVSEGFVLAEKLGLDLKTFFDISSHASGQCWSMTSYCPVPGIIENAPSNNQYQPGFMAKMMLKDLLLAQQAAEQAGAFLPLGTEATALYAELASQGKGELDFSGIIQLIKGVK